MKINRFRSRRYLHILPLALLFIFSCKKNRDTPVNSFTWTYSDQHYIANIDSAFLFATVFDEHIIVAKMGSDLSSISTGPRMVMFSLSTGSHNIPYSVEMATSFLIYTDDLGNILQANSGTINITENTGSYLSGDCSVILDDGKSLTATFLNVPIRK